MAKRFDYEYHGHKIGLIFGNREAVLIVDGEIQHNLRNTGYINLSSNSHLTPMFPLKAELPTGERIVAKINTDPTFSEVVHQTPLNARKSTKFEVKVDGVAITPLPEPSRTRDRASLQRLAENYDRLGRLSNAEFMAIKNLSKPISIIVGKEPFTSPPGIVFPCDRCDRDQIRAEFGGHITGEVIRPGDDVMLGGFYKIQDGKKSYSNVNTTLSNITSCVHWDEREASLFVDYRRGYLFENANEGMTNIDFSDEQRQLNAVLQQPNCPLTKELLTSIITKDTTLEEYMVIRELRDRGIEITDQVLDDLAQGMDLKDVIERAQSEMERNSHDVNSQEVDSEYSQDDHERQ